MKAYIFTEEINMGDKPLDLIAVLKNASVDSKTQGSGIFYVESDGSERFQTYSELWDNARILLYGLNQFGLKKGDKVIFQLKDELRFINLFWACLLGGIVPVPLSVALASENTEGFTKLINVKEQLNNPLIVTEAILREVFDRRLIDSNNLSIVNFEELEKLAILPGEVNQPEPGDLAFVQFSSGSTGSPKGVMLTHANLVNNIFQLCTHMKMTNQDVIANWTPLTHDMGIILLHLTFVGSKSSQVKMSPETFIKKPALFLEKVTEHRATFFGCPNFALAWILEKVTEQELAKIDLSSVRLMINGAEPISMKVARDFITRMAKCNFHENAMYFVYGMAEASVGACFPPLNTPPVSHKFDRSMFTERQVVKEATADDTNFIEFADVGYPLPGMEIRILDERDRLVEENVVGNIVIKGPNVTSGYINNPKVNQKLFADGYLRTGDLGMIRNQRLIITGRKKDIIFFNGQNFYSHDIERICIEMDGISTGKVAVCASFDEITGKDELIIFIQFRKKPEQFIKTLLVVKEHVARKIGQTVSHVIPVKMIPRTTSGKLQRYKLERQYRTGKFAALISQLQELEEQTGLNGLPRNEIDYYLVKLWSKHLKKDSVGIYDDFFALGGDSLKMMQLCAELSAFYKMELNTGDFIKMGQIATLSDYIAIHRDSVRQVKYPLKTGDLQHFHLPFPLTEVQMAYLMGRNGQFELGGVSTHGYYEIETQLDIERLSASLRKVIQRHPMVRTIIDPNGEQKILAQVQDYQITVNDISHLSPSEQQQLILKERDRMSHAIFPPDQWPLFEFKALKLTCDSHYLFLGFDLLIADGASIRILIQDMMAFYREPQLELAELEFNFRDYILSYLEFKKTETYQSDKDYWLGKLADFPSAPALPLRKELKEIVASHFNRHWKVYNRAEWAELKRLAREHHITVSALLGMAYAQVLAYWSNQPHMALNVTLFNRFPFHPEINKIIGDFTSVLLLDLELEAGDSFWEQAAQLQSRLMEALDHRHYDGVEFIRELSKYHGLEGKALMPVVFTSMLAGADDDEQCGSMSDLGVIKTGISQTPQVYLDYQAAEYDGALHVSWDYIEELFDPNVIATMFEQYIGILDKLLVKQEETDALTFAQTAIALEAKSLLTGDEGWSYLKLSDPVAGFLRKQDEILNRYNQTETSLPVTTLHCLFAKQAGRTPEQTAVVYEDQNMTYRDLDERSNRLAHYLKEQGIGRTDLVGVLAYRDPRTIVNMMGILKAGAAYVPIEPEYPEERKQYILENSHCKMLLDPEFYQGNRLFEFLSDPIIDTHNPEDVAYVIYTSGSTGRPKGVVITHAAAANTIMDINQRFNVTGDDRIIGLSSMCFDLSVYDIFGTLATGATLVLIPDVRDIKHLQTVMARERITIWNSVPAIMDMFLGDTGKVLDSRQIGDSFNWVVYQHQNDSLRLVLLSGDWIPLRLPDNIKANFPNADVISLGGATEASIWSIYYPIGAIQSGWKSIPYGMPLANQKFYVLNYRLGLCPIGVPGELYIGGVGLASGYLNDTEKTSKAFIKHPLLGNLYRTGDYGVFHQEGYIEFLGRKDHQVKIRGYRIELGEIESRLVEHTQVKKAVVIDRTDLINKKYLCAYVVADMMPEAGELRRFLARDLPDYMIPQYFIQIDEIPLSPNGKVERRALPEIVAEATRGLDYVPPGNAVEERLAAIWEEVLGVERVGTHDNFFFLGGDSIKAIQISAKAKQTGFNISLTDIYSQTTIANLATKVDFARKKVQVQQETVIGEVMLTPIQKCFFEQGLMHPEYWNFSRLFELRKGTDLDVLAKGFSRLAEHHDALRTVFKFENNQVRQYIKPFAEASFQLEKVDLAKYDPTSRNLRLKEYGERVQGSFDLENGPLIKAVIFDLAEENQRLMIVVHHLIIDGISWRIIIEDLENLYNSGANTVLPLKTTSFKEWAQELSDYARQNVIDTGYWRDIGAKNQTVETKRSLFRDFQVRKIKFNPAQTSDIMTKTGGVSNTAIQEILLSGLLMAVNETMRMDNLLLTMEGHGREEFINDVDISRTVGWFTSEYPVYFSKQSGIFETLKHVKDTLHLLPGRGINFGLGRYLKNDESLKTLNPEVAFNYLGQFGLAKLTTDPLFVDSEADFGPTIHPENTFVHQLYIYGQTRNACLEFQVIYNSNIYSDELMGRFCNAYQKNLLEIARYCEVSTVDIENMAVSEYQGRIPDPDKLNEPFSLTAVQMAYLMGRDPHFQLGGVSTHYYAEIETKQDIARFNQSLNRVIRRHPMLRAIVLPDGQQRILKDVPEYQIEVQDLRGMTEIERADCIAGIRKRMSHHIFKSDEWPLFEYKAFKLNYETNYICMGFDLMIADGASFQIIGRELKEFYEHPDLELADLEFSFRDYMLAYEEFKNSQICLEDKKFWHAKLEGFPSAPAVPVRVDPSSVKSPYFKRKTIGIAKECWEKLKLKAIHYNITPSALLCTAYAEVLARWSNQPDLAINLTVFNRHPFHRQVNEIVGDFTSLILVDIHLKVENTFWQNAQAVQMTLMEALDHRHYDGVEFIRDVTRYNGLENIAAMPIVFTSMLFDDNRSGLSDLFGNMKYGISQTSQVYLDYQVMELEGNLSITWDYVEDLFEETVIDTMFAEYCELLEKLKGNDDTLTPVIGAKDRQVIERYNDTAKNIEPVTLQKLFSEQVKRTPQNIAVKLGEQSLTYRELDQRSHRIAGYLREQGISRNDLVGVYAKRDVNTIVNVIGILKAGAAYVPVEPEYPEERRNYIISNSNCRLMLEPDFYQVKGLEEYATDHSEVDADIDDIAYIIYTSGSTGRPKGVIITHRAASNTIIDINQKFQVSAKDRIIGLSSMCFDLSVYDIFGALSTGATLVMVPDQRDVLNLIDIVIKEKITIWNSVPAIMDMVVGNADADFQSTDLRAVLLSGDWIGLKLPEKIRQHFKNAEIISLGGATEASIWSIYYLVKEIKEEWKSIPYGMPLANQKFYILNYRREWCPIGVPGELYIGGVGVAKGYLNDREKTKDSFIHHSEFGYIYKTGDYGVLHPEGYIEFLGRKDQQVKIRGYRIELGEIESRMMEYPQAKSVVVIDRNDLTGKKYLCGYVVMTGQLDAKALREFLAEALPEYMIPTHFVQLEQIPLTSNGKVDAKHLPEPVVKENTELKSTGPRNEIEVIMVEIWQNVLGLGKVEISDSFFALGGDSIKAIQICAQLQKQGMKLEVQNIFYQQTIEKISGQVKKETLSFDQGIVQGELGLVPIQKWFFEKNHVDINHWNQAFGLYRKMGFDEEKLPKVFDKIIEHHDALRSIFVRKHDSIIQYIREMTEGLYSLQVFDLADQADCQSKVIEISDGLQRKIDLENGPLVKLGLFKTQDGDYLVIIIHHLVVDGVSWRILFEDIAEGYNQLCRDEQIQFPKKTYSVKNWSDQLYKYADSIGMAKEVDYWQSLTRETAGVLPKKTEVTENKVKNSRAVSMVLSDSDTAKLLKNVHQAYNTEINEILLAALGMALNNWTGVDRFFINLEGHGRENIIDGFDHSRIVGWFTSLFPVLLANRNSQNIGAWIESVKDTLRRIPNKGVGYGILKYLTARENTRNIDFSLKPEIGFNYLGEFEEKGFQEMFELSTELAGDWMGPESDRDNLLDIVGMVTDGKMVFKFIFNYDVFDETDISRLMKDYGDCLAAIVKHCENCRETQTTVSDFSYKELSDDEFEDILTMLNRIRM